MIRYIDEHKDQFGVEAICRVLRPAVRGFITSRGYRAAKTRPPSARTLKDELLVPEIARMHAENYGVYGVRKMHALMRRQGWDIGRDQTARLMKIADVGGGEAVEEGVHHQVGSGDGEAGRPGPTALARGRAAASVGC